MIHDEPKKKPLVFAWKGKKAKVESHVGSTILSCEACLCADGHHQRRRHHEFDLRGLMGAYAFRWGVPYQPTIVSSTTAGDPAGCKACNLAISSLK